MIPPGLTYITDNIISKDNLIGASKKRGAEWARSLNLPEKRETVFFAGCGYQYSNELESMMGLIQKVDKSFIGAETAMKLANFQKKLGIDATGIFRSVAARGNNKGAQPLVDAIRILKKIGVEIGYLAENEPCCGGPLYYVGRRREFDKHAGQVQQRFDSAGVKKIISIIPSCTNALRNLIPESTDQNNIEVKHFCEVLAENLSSLKLKFPGGRARIAYHDSCQLVRFMGLIEQPRRILRAIDGIELVENEQTCGEYATCCGGGGGFEAVFPELSLILAVNRVRELLETGAKIIVTHCPGCIMQLKSGLKELKVNDVEVLDLTQIVAMSMEEE